MSAVSLGLLQQLKTIDFTAFLPYAQAGKIVAAIGLIVIGLEIIGMLPDPEGQSAPPNPQPAPATTMSPWPTAP